jgi:hypothetical protein
MKPTICLMTLVALLLVCDWWEIGRGLSQKGAGEVTRIAPAQFPTSLQQLLGSAPTHVAECDIAFLNLLCAEGLPGAENLNPQDCITTLDRWAERVRSETERHLYRFKANPREFESSEGYFRMLMMAVVLYEDFSVRYNPARMSAPGAVDWNDHFFADSRDVFLHGMVENKVQGLESKVLSLESPPPGSGVEPGRDAFHRVPLFSGEVTDAVERVPTTSMGRVARPARPLGTCSSMPVLYVAIGRRLGYPLKLATTKSHVFMRWEGAGERFDLEATGKGMNRYDDEHFKQWPFPVSEAEIQADGYLKSLTAVEELALFLSLRGHCLKEAGRMPEAVAAYAEAVRLAPASRPYRFLLAAAQQERAYPASGAGVPPASAAGVPPATGPPTYAQAPPLLPPPPAASGFVPRSPSPTALQPAPAGAVSALPSPLNPQPSTLNQPGDPNPLLKLRQP